MPKDFDICRSAGGKIRTMRVGHGEYMHICIDKQGKSHAGYVKKMKREMDKDDKKKEKMMK